ncbi:MAG: type II secretion system F family protein [Candidatus Aenigmatarchaeota archaeon]
MEEGIDMPGAKPEEAGPAEAQPVPAAMQKLDEVEMEFKSADEIEVKLLGRKIVVKKNTAIVLALNTALVAAILLINFLMLSDVPSLFSTINIIAMFIFVLPIILIRYTEYKELKEVEEMFPVFLRDFVQTIRSGMTLPAAIKAVAKNDYKSLNSYVRRMSAQLDWGITVNKVLTSFGRRSKSKLIMRIISSVIESHRFGGNLSDTFEALSNTAVEIDRLREERKLYMNSQMITGYVVFFVFLAVMIGLEKFLVPSMADISTGGIMGGAAVGPSNIAEEYKVVFRNLILIQGLFAGLAVGKMAEGAIAAGLKHSVFMMFVGFLVFTVAG